MNSKVTGVLNSTLEITIRDLQPHLVSEDLAVVKSVMSILCLNLNGSRSLLGAYMKFCSQSICTIVRSSLISFVIIFKISFFFIHHSLRETPECRWTKQTVQISTIYINIINVVCLQFFSTNRDIFSHFRKTLQCVGTILQRF